MPREMSLQHGQRAMHPRSSHPYQSLQKSLNRSSRSFRQLRISCAIRCTVPEPMLSLSASTTVPVGARQIP
jgi:hypothetical protein